MSSRRLSPLTATRVSPPFSDMNWMDCRPRSSAVKKRLAESGDQVKLFTHRSIFSVRSVTRFSCPLQHHQPPAVALITCAHLRAPREILAIGRILRGGIGSRIVGDLAGRTARDGNGEEIRIGADGGHRIGVHRIADFHAVRRNGVIVGAAQRKRRHIAIARRKIDNRAARYGVTSRWLRRAVCQWVQCR